MVPQEKQLKTIECVNALLNDLYIELRQKVNYWSALTDQTAQARMGYIGQHLVSAVTGYKGGKSGARGKDLVITDNEYAEIKTCSRVDQLGICKKCQSPVSPIETKCAFCGSNNIVRKDDSKWLISITEEYPSTYALVDSEDILININKPKYFYFVLFEFENIKISTSPIVVTVYRVDPKTNGFTLCMLDYFYNIKKNAPFNMWPHMLKFNLCYPEIVYRSTISVDGDITTIHFNNETPLIEPFDNLLQYSQSRNLTDSTLANLCQEFDISSSTDKKYVLSEIEKKAKETNMDNNVLINKFANAFYRDSIHIAIEKLAREGRCIPSVFDSYIDAL